MLKQKSPKAPGKRCLGITATKRIYPPPPKPGGGEGVPPRNDLRDSAAPPCLRPGTRRWYLMRYPMDVICLSYLSAMVLLLLCCHRHVANWSSLALQFALFALGICFLILLDDKFPGRGISSTARLIYPVAVIATGWGALTQLVPLLYGSYWTTSWVIYTDRLLFGVYPTVWMVQYHRPWLDELMNIFYSGYYLLMPGIVLTLLISGKRRQLVYALSLVSFTYLGNFVFFLLLPTLGPQLIPEIAKLGGGSYSGYWIAAATRWIQSNGGAIGGAFPSSHVSGAVIWTLVALDLNRPLGVCLALLVPGIAVSTVYLGYHHALDPLAGILWGFLAYGLIKPSCYYLVGGKR